MDADISQDFDVIAVHGAGRSGTSLITKIFIHPGGEKWLYSITITQRFVSVLPSRA